MNNTPKPNKKLKFNFADIIITLIIVSLLFLLFKLFTGDLSLDLIGKSEVKYTIKIENLDEDIAQLILQDQTLYDNQTGNPIGTIESFSVTDAVYTEYDSDAGYYKNYSYPDLKNVSITVVGQCKEKNNIISVNGIEIIQGKPLSFRTVSIYADGVVTDVQKISNNPSVINDSNASDALE